MVEQEAPEVTDFHRRTNEHKIAFLRAVVQALHGNILPLDNYMKLNDVSRMNEPDFDFKAFEYISSVAAKIVFNELLGYGVPTSEVLDMAMKYQPLVEVGAGTGLIAKLLQDKGCKIVASDPYHEDCPYKFKVNRFGNVIKAFGPEAIRRYHARNVLIVWPSLGEPWGTACLKAMKSGRIVVGEQPA